MNTNTCLPSEVCAVLGGIDPDAYAASTVVTDYADMSKFESVMFVLEVGDIVATGTVDAVVHQATDSSGTGAKVLTSSKAITQLTQAGSDSNKQVVVNVRAEDLDLANGFDFCALSVTMGTAGADLSCLVLGFNPHYLPASDNDIASVDEIVS